MTEINNLTKAKIDSNFVKVVVREFLRQMKIDLGSEVSIVFVGNRKIQDLNRIYRKKDQVTDVLAFSNLEGRKVITPRSELLYLGEVIISYEQAKRQAKEYGHSIKKELKILLIHGLLHLLKYDHGRPKERAAMEKLEKELSSYINF